MWRVTGPLWRFALIYVALLSVPCRTDGACSENSSDLLENSSADFYQKLHSGKILFFYFKQHESSSACRFLVELLKSAEALRDYGVLVGTLSCESQAAEPYCGEQRGRHSAFLFRGGKEFLSFPLDTVFDVHSIVSEVLFAILRDEVRYVHTDADLLAMEKAAWGKRDMVLGYVRSLGTPEHRSVMETAYVYGSKHQFILITGGPVLKQLGVNQSSVPSCVWFLHCGSEVSGSRSERCPVTRMRKPVSTLNLHCFLQLMEAPLLSEVHVPPSSVPPPPQPYHLTPQLFLFARPATKLLDVETARAAARRLRGHALLTLVHTQNPAVGTMENKNAAYRFPVQSLEVKYVRCQSLEEVLQLFINTEEEIKEEEEEKEEEVYSDGLDDEVAFWVFKNEENLQTGAQTDLTSDNLHGEVSQHGLTVALFYLKWDAVSSAFLPSFNQVAEKLAAVSDVLMGSVDCGEWTDLCAEQPITAFPTVLMLRPQEPAQRYSGILGSEALHRFILMSRLASPWLLSSQQEVTSFLQTVPPELRGFRPDRILGVFSSATQAGFSAFSEAATTLRGEILIGLLLDGPAEKWAAAQATELPVVLLYPSWRTRPSLLRASAADLLVQIKAALLPPVPELTVQNLPSFLQQGKALLLLFVGEEEDEIGRRENEALLEEMRSLVEVGGARVGRYLPCWIHLGRTPAGLDVLGAYLGAMPPLPALILRSNSPAGEIYQFPAQSSITTMSVLQWLGSVEGGAEAPAGTLGGDAWPPAADFYDFLSIMDAQEAGTEEEANVEEHLVAENAFKSKIHSEL